MKRLFVFLLLLWSIPIYAAVTRDGSCAAASTSCTVTTGASANGDLLIVFAYRNASTTPPSTPAGYTSIATSSGGATNSFDVYCHVASGASDTTGVATNATGIVAVWYSGTSATNTAACATQAVAIGVVGTGNQQSGTSTTATYSGLTTSSGTTSSWIVGFMGDNVAADNCTPTGMTSVATAGQATVSDTNAAVSTWTQVTCSITSATYRTYVLEVLAADSGAGSGTPALVQVHDCAQAWGPFYLANPSTLMSGHTWECRLPQGAKVGNAIIVALSNDPGYSVPTITDDKSDTYNLAVNYHDSTNNENVLLFYATNVKVDAQNITIHLGTGTGTPYVNPWIAEFTNVALSNASECVTGNNASSTSVTAGSCTPGHTNDLVVQHYWNDYSVATTSLASGTGQANITWSLLTGDYDTGVGSQWGVYGSTSALNPTMTTAPVGFASVALFLRSSSAGTAATGIRVLALKDMWANATTVTEASPPPYNANTRTFPFPCPASSNLMYAAWIGGGGATLTSITDSHSQTWTTTGAGVTNDSYSRAFYQDAATVSTNQTVTMVSTVNTSSGDGTPKFYCVTGAATSSAFDHTATLTGTQSSTTGTLATVAITPVTSNGIIFASAGNALTTLRGLNVGWFHSGFNDAENIALSGVDENNGWGLYQNPSTSAVTFTWTEVDSSTAAGQWVARADAFKGVAVAASPQRGKAVIF